MRAAQLGIAGGYVYVLLYLGQRGFRNDITSGGAMWCTVVLAVGPLIAWTISHFWHGGAIVTNPAGQVASSTGHAASPDLSGDAVYFVAGLAPRHVTAFVEEAVRRLWRSPSNTIVSAPRTLPVTQLRGITLSIADRLTEEGIDDLYGMSTTDPLRMIRNTNFGKRQILTWIDEAILIATLPMQWQALEAEGITGAIDLVSLRLNPDAAAIGRLRERLKFDDASIFDGVLTRLSQDAQVQLIWVLYQRIDQMDAQDELQDDTK